jgi:hypothetical protein
MISFKTGINFHLTIFFTALLIACQQPAPKKDNPYTKEQIEIKVFSNDTTADSAIGGYGYNVYLHNTLYVHQPNMPAVNGNRGFKSAADAEKTAGLTAYKIMNNIMPPSLTVSELDSLGVTK